LLKHKLGLFWQINLLLLPWAGFTLGKKLNDKIGSGILFLIENMFLVII